MKNAWVVWANTSSSWEQQSRWMQSNELFIVIEKMKKKADGQLQKFFPCVRITVILVLWDSSYG